MDTEHVVRTFVEYYEDHGHRRITGSTLLPEPGDPVLFTSAGMHPLTPYLEGRPHPLGRRLVNVQRCLRTTDLDEVGDRTHLTVFQMLGTWSLGDYEGPTSLEWAHRLLTEGLGVDPGLLHATVYGAASRPGRTPSPCGCGRSSVFPWNRPRTTTGGPTGRWARAVPTRRSSCGAATPRPAPRPPGTTAGWRCGTT